MGSYLNPKNKGFRESLASEIYVDKSGLIADTNQCLGTKQNSLAYYSARDEYSLIWENSIMKALEHYTGDILLVGVNYGKDSKNHQCVIEQYQK